MKKSGKKLNLAIKLILGLLATLILLYFILSQVDVQSIKKSISYLSAPAISLAFLLYIMVYLFRALRFHALLKDSIKIRDMFFIVCIYNLFAQIIPARIGEFSYIYMVKKRGVPLRSNIMSIAISKMLDICVISIIFFVGVAALPLFYKDIYPLFIAALAMLLAIITFLVLAASKPEIFIRITRMLARNMRNKPIKFVLLKIEEVFSEFKVLMSRHMLAKVLAYSLIAWLSAYASTFILLNLIFPNLTFLNVFFIASVPILFSLIPISTIGGFGITEAGFLFPLLLFKVPVAEAISAGLVVHVMQILFIMLLGLIGYVYRAAQNLLNKEDMFAL